MHHEDYPEEEFFNGAFDGGIQSLTWHRAINQMSRLMGISERDIEVEVLPSPSHWGADFAQTVPEREIIVRARGQRVYLSPRDHWGQDPRENIKPKPAFQIVAPAKDFDMSGRIIVGHKIEEDDPIVLQPVKGGYLIVSKWGPEASDTSLINEIFN